jgi:hypothetical protein
MIMFDNQEKNMINTQRAFIEKHSFSIKDILKKNINSLKWVFTKWACKKETIQNILNLILSWTKKDISYENIRVIYLQDEINRIIFRVLQKEIIEIVTCAKKKTIIKDNLQYSNAAGDVIKPVNEVKYIEGGSMKTKWRDIFIDTINNNPNINDKKKFLENYDPKLRWEVKKVSTKKYILEWFKNINGLIIELGLARHLHINNVKCLNCNKAKIGWCGGRKSSWSDCICTNCHAFYEIKSKKNDESIKKIIEKRETYGGSYKQFLCQKLNNINHYLILVSRNSGKVWYNKIDTNNVLIDLTVHTFTRNDYPMKSIVKLVNTKKWKEAYVNVQDLPLEKTILNGVSIMFDNINNKIVKIQSIVRGYILRKRNKYNRIPSKILFLLPDGRYIY